MTPVLHSLPGARKVLAHSQPAGARAAECGGMLWSNCKVWDLSPTSIMGRLMWGLYRLWVLPTLELAFEMDSYKVLYQSNILLLIYC